MKAILMSIRPEWVAKILNGEKTIEIRKRFPSDYVGWVYIYCTKDNELLCQIDNEWNTIKVVRGAKLKSIYNGKVVARFWCDKVEQIIFGTTLYNDLGFFTCDLHDFDLYKQSCLTKKEMQNYLKIKPNGLSGYAIHITNLEIFDKPKEISEFVPYNIKKNHYKPFPTCDFRLTRAPQSWQFIEVDL